MSSSSNAKKILDNEHLVRSCPNERVIYDENLETFRFLEEEFTFPFDQETNQNLGLSTDHMEWSIQQYNAMAQPEALKNYITEIFSANYFAKKSWAVMNVGKIKKLALNVENTPTKTNRAERPFHCDILPTHGQNDYINDQKKNLYYLHEIIVNNSN